MPARRNCEDARRCYCSCLLCKKGHVTGMWRDHCGNHEFGCHELCLGIQEGDLI